LQGKSTQSKLLFCDSRLIFPELERYYFWANKSIKFLLNFH